MFKLILIGTIITAVIAMARLKYKYDKEYLIPTIEENPDLSNLFKIAFALVLLIFIGVIYKIRMLFYIGCGVGIPILLYANIKSNILARKYKLKK